MCYTPTFLSVYRVCTLEPVYYSWSDALQQFTLPTQCLLPPVASLALCPTQTLPALSPSSVVGSGTITHQYKFKLHLLFVFADELAFILSPGI